MLYLMLIHTVSAGVINPSSMSEWSGQSYTSTSSIQQGYGIVVKQLGMSIANKPSAGTSSGIYGFEMTIKNSIAFVDSKDYVDGSPSPWNLISNTEEAPPALWLPSVEIRKGLPLSLEIGAQAGLVVTDVGSTFGSYVRCSPMEGYKNAPDITIQYVYAGYIGNPDLALSTMDLSLSIGKGFAFGPLANVNSSIIHPYAGAGMYWLRADPRLDSSEESKLGIGAISSFSKSDEFTEGYRLFAWDLGVRIQSNEMLVSFSSSHSPGNLWSVNSSIGYSF
jgi:hypothetical protein